MNARASGLALLLWTSAIVLVLLGAACSDESKAKPAPTVEPTPTQPACPVDQAICDFAATVEKLLQARDYAAIAATAPGITDGVRQQAEQAIVSGKPTLVSIGCPFGAVSESCSKYFSLVFTTFRPTEDWTARGGIFILMYERRSAQPGPGLRMANRVEEFDMRRAALAGGLAQGPCNFSGWADDQGEQGCARSWFHPYSTDGAVFAPVQASPGDSFTVLAPAAPPNNSALFIATGCWACEGFDRGIQLVLTDANGVTTTEPVPEPPLEPGETRTEFAMSADGSLLLAGACRATNCGPLGPSTADTQTRVLASRDAGQSWSQVAGGPGFFGFEIGPGNKVLLSRYYGSGAVEEWTTTWEMLVSGEKVTRPANAHAEARPVFLPDGSIGWTRYEGLDVLRSDGSVFFTMAGKITAADRVSEFRFGPDGRIYVRWTSGQAPAGGALKSYLSSFNPAGVELWRRELSGQEFYLGAFSSSRLSLANLQDPAPNSIGMLPALVDMDAATIQPFTTSFGSGQFSGRNRFIARVEGPFARVATGSDCLNVRETPSTSARVLQCAANGALLQVFADSTSQAEGIGWVKVRTLAGEEGWASSEFLVR